MKGVILNLYPSFSVAYGCICVLWDDYYWKFEKCGEKLKYPIRKDLTTISKLYYTDSVSAITDWMKDHDTKPP